MMWNIVIAFLISALMGTGIGGGGFLVIYLTLCLNYEQIIAQGTNLVFFAICGIFSLLVHMMKRKISLRQVIPMSVFGSLGAIVLSRLANLIDPKIPRIALGIFLVASGILGLINSIKNKEK
ncbi:MAG: sulfite exporter TauE/SafE family protein [Clostridia bacterium]|nr:sulfite exporter TauE/SafE family protein [Clostridia bacterium]